MTKPTRTFSANVGDRSIGNAGPDAIENDIDAINKMFDPLQPGGGIGPDNMADFTINQDIVDMYSNTGTPTELMSWIVKTIKSMKGTVTNWYDAGAATIEAIWGKFNAVTGHTHTGGANDAPRIGTSGLIDGAVTETKIGTGAVTDSKITGPITGSKIANTPAGNISSTDMQAAIYELDAEKINVSEVSVIASASKIPRANAEGKITYSTTGDADATVAKLETHKTSTDHDGRYYTEVEIDAKLADLAGVGRTIETIKGNTDNLNIHKTSSDHDSRYYTKTQLDQGQLDNRYYTETEVNERKVYPAVATTTALPIDDPIGTIRIVLNKGDGTSGTYQHQGSGIWTLIGNSAVTDHGALTGLLDDDHPQYALDSELANLAGVGRTTETVKGNADNLAAHLADIAAHSEDYAHTITNTYTNGLLTQIDKTVGGVLRERWTYSYDLNGNLTSVNTKIYASDGVTIQKQFTDTYTYAGSDITSVQRTVG